MSDTTDDSERVSRMSDEMLLLELKSATGWWKKLIEKEIQNRKEKTT